MPRRLGQHFLIDTSVLQRIADVLDVQTGDAIIEIGPGHGELTEKILAKKPAALHLIEKDVDLAKRLREKYSATANVVVREGDVRELLAALVEKEMRDGERYKVIGNIPYYLTGYLFRILGDLTTKPQRIVLTIQKEVADRLVAKAPQMNKLAAAVQFWGDTEKAFDIPAAAFNPPPDVDSATISIVPHPTEIEPAMYFALLQRLFAQPRKTIANNLAAKGLEETERAHVQAVLTSLSIDPQWRPQNLSVSLIVRLAKALSA